MIGAVIDTIIRTEVLFHLLCLSFFLSSIWGSFKKPFYKAISAHRISKYIHANIATKVIGSNALYLIFHFLVFLWTPASDYPSLIATQQNLFIGALNFLLSIIVYRFNEQIVQDYEKVIDIEEKALTEQTINWKPPPMVLLDVCMKLNNIFLNPQFLGLENIPYDKPVLFVGNHALMGVDMPLLIFQLYKERNIFLRGLADSFHFSIPVWGEILRAMGAVVGSRPTCSSLMKAGENILVYPGGAHEVLKKKSDDKYELKWKQRTGFARLAIQHQYTIIPVCAVGTNEMLDIVADVPVGWAFGGARGDLSVPIVKPPLPSAVQRVYFGFGKPIETIQLKGDTSAENCNHIRDLCKEALESEIHSVCSHQKNDPYRNTIIRLKKQTKMLLHLHS